MDSSFGSQLAAAEATFLLVAAVLLVLLGVGLAYLVPFVFHHIAISIH